MVAGALVVGGGADVGGVNFVLHRGGLDFDFPGGTVLAAVTPVVECPEWPTSVGVTAVAGDVTVVLTLKSVL